MPFGRTLDPMRSPGRQQMPQKFMPPAVRDPPRRRWSGLMVRAS